MSRCSRRRRSRRPGTSGRSPSTTTASSASAETLNNPPPNQRPPARASGDLRRKAGNGPPDLFLCLDGGADRRKLTLNKVDSAGPANTFLLGRRNPGSMVTHRETIPLETRRGVQAIDITDRVAKVIEESVACDGLACAFTPSSPHSIVANQFEPEL